ncbi:uncharacterized protein LOC113235811 [Hyposmocoma kahamanoa]|uniref:uncharacterized protein LOC113235811 n=1 Tax=Hyposmocoma kahamanoa TaxID=1477025 RepID=UPI000E6DA353|nr:uncharacterized protein LOC113235811 [Hyposmocoma kahamanoa]
MELPKLIILLCCTYYSFASDHSHIIPVEKYETELQDLGQHVDIPETPVKVVKITKTIAVKIPVPYPVKVVEKVPYPVHVSKPYPVPVPHIVHVPHPGKSKSFGGHEAIDVSHASLQHGGQDDSQYKVQDSPSYDTSSGGHSFGPAAGGQYFQGNSNHGQSFGAHDDDHSFEGGSYDAPNSYYGYSGDNDGHGSFESKSYDLALKEYLQKQKSGGNFHNH